MAHDDLWFQLMIFGLFLITIYSPKRVKALHYIFYMIVDVLLAVDPWFFSPQRGGFFYVKFVVCFSCSVFAFICGYAKFYSAHLFPTSGIRVGLLLTSSNSQARCFIVGANLHLITSSRTLNTL